MSSALYSKPYMIHRVTESANEMLGIGPNSSKGSKSRLTDTARKIVSIVLTDEMVREG